jgi:LmbE family N-acetylglucosaminyl deacetylase
LVVTPGGDLTLDGVRRLVVVSAHPDDADLGARGLIATATAAGLDVHLLSAGERNDPDQPGRLAALTTTLVDLIGDGRGTVIVSTWTEDGHPDHEAVGRAAAAAARRTEAQHWQFPLWFWHWASPDDARARTLRPLPLTDEARRAVDRVVGAHAAGDSEWFMVVPGSASPDQELEEVHRDAQDPWGVDSRWYEHRKRDLLLASLPRPRFERVLEVGCSTGALTAALSTRADHVLAVDSSETALAAARRRLEGTPGVDVARLDVPAEWPDEEFDLVVVSEVGYFLSPAALERLVTRVAGSLTPDGVVVLCHWRHRVEGWVMDAERVHAGFEDDQLPPLQATYRDRDVELRVHAATWPPYDA